MSPVSILLPMGILFGLTEEPVGGNKPSADASPVAVKAADLKDQLEKGLKARRPSEFAFIARVVRLVERERLPRSLVEGTFLWARPKRPRPYQYFERAMRIRARRLGINL